VSGLAPREGAREARRGWAIYSEMSSGTGTSIASSTWQ
jgi:hypothetical protein